jgi:tetratricopeptide (TPR) repeat protein
MFCRNSFKIALMALALPLAAMAQSNETLPGAVALDPAAAGIAAVNAAADIFKAQSPDAAISYFNDVLNQTRNPAVARAIRFQLADLYKQTNRPDQALEQLKELIASIPPLAPEPAQVIQVAPTDTTANPPAAPQQ